MYLTEDFKDTGSGYHSLKNFGSNVVVTAPNAGTFADVHKEATANNAKIGVFPSTSEQRLIFYLKVTG